MTVKRGVPFAMTVTMGRLLSRKNGAGCAS